MDKRQLDPIPEIAKAISLGLQFSCS